MELRKLTPEHLGLIESLLDDGRTVRISVTGASMTPTIQRRDVVHLTAATEVDVGEIVLVRTQGGRPLLHRVVARDERRVQTRGDALPEPDGWTPIENVLGRAIRVEPPGVTTRAYRLAGALRRRLSP